MNKVRSSPTEAELAIARRPHRSLPHEAAVAIEGELRHQQLIAAGRNDGTLHASLST
jgi:hypothetical protein